MSVAYTKLGGSSRSVLTFNYLYNVGPCSKFHMHFQISSQVSCLGSELVASF